jgi:hypothetical protein
MIKYIPYPVTMGFTSGIAVLIFSTQIKDFFGLRIDKIPSEFFEKMKALIQMPAQSIGQRWLWRQVHWPSLSFGRNNGIGASTDRLSPFFWLP